MSINISFLALLGVFGRYASPAEGVGDSLLGLWVS
jgi:hypothetical protein